MPEPVEARRPCVVVADDDRDIRELVAVKLRQAGYDVVAVSDGVEAVAAVRERGPVLAVLDVMMPGLSGFDVVREIRAGGSGGAADRDIAIVLLTARSQQFDIEAGFALGADDYIVKPFSPRELLHRVDAVLGRGRG